MNIKVYFNRQSAVDNEEPKVISNVTRSDYRLVGINWLKRYSVGELEWLGFDHELMDDPSEAMVLTPMLIPSYFAETGNREIHGSFLIPIGAWSNDKEQSEPAKFFGDKGIGRFGCPKPIEVNSNGYFRFNKQRFYPFIMTDFSTGYYVRDEPANGEAPEWPGYETEQRNRGVALDYPVSFDPSLGLYVTRGAHIVLPGIAS